MELQHDGQVGRELDCSEQPYARIADAEAKQPAGDRDDQAFGEELPDESSAPRADGQAQRHLPCSNGRPAGQQPANVAACDEQHREGKR